MRSKHFYRGLACLAAAAGLFAARPAVAQDIAITNVRIVQGNGPVIESGTIIVRGGKIASVSSGGANTQGLRVIDGKGMTAMPGFIDDHKHVNDGPNAKAQMQSLLEAGYTTILSGGSMPGSDVALRDKIDRGEYNGPRILPSIRINLRQKPEEAAAAVQMGAAQGYKYTAEIALTPEPGPPPQEIATLKAIVAEAAKVGMQVNVHAVSTRAMIVAIDAGVRRLVHLPNKDWTSFDAAAKVAQTGSIVSGLIAFGAPIIDRESPAPAPVVFPRDDTPRFRDGRPWPEAIAGANRDEFNRATGTEAGYEIVNARRIWDADPNHQTMSFSTDQNYADKVVLEHELKSFSIMFSMPDIIKIIGPNAARFVGMEDQIGTLEPGKLADIVLLNGNPLAIDGIYNMLKTTVVLKEGKVVVDKRETNATH
jgi:imidazolonepropionase-like amidohydrolase